MEIDLGAPLFVEIVGVTKDRLVAVTDVNRACDKFVMLGVITRFNVRLRIDMTVR